MRSLTPSHLTLSTHPGITLLLFYQCMRALLGPTNRPMGRIKWGLVVHTITMFSFLTINCFMNFAIQSIAYIDNRAFARKGMFPGPFVYQLDISSEPINVIPSVMFYLNNWLADGLLVSSVLNFVALTLTYVGRPASSTAATSFMARTSGSWASHS